MAYGKFKMVTNPKGVEDARRQQEKQKRNPSKGTKEAPIVKFGSERRAKPMPLNIDELRNRGNSPRKPNPEKRPPRRPLNPGGTAEKRPPRRPLNPGGTAEKRPLPKPGKTLIDIMLPGKPGSVKMPSIIRRKRPVGGR